MNYNEAIDYIHSTYKFGSKLGLDNITDLLNRLGNPHNGFKCIHVGGTNGKGSVTAMITNILKESGFKVGMFTSPYLERFTERIQVDLNEISETDLGRITGIVKEKVDQMLAEGMNHPTEFEIVTAIGFYYFYEQKVDYAVVEVGLGGRLDSTNVVDPVVSVITSISYDHMDILGDTLSKIAFEKGGIIKHGKPVVLYPQDEEASGVIKKIAKERNAPIFEVDPDRIVPVDSSFGNQVFHFNYGGRFYENLRIKLSGKHQILNAATALTVIMVLKDEGVNIEDSSIFTGLEKTLWPGRMELVRKNPPVIIDGAHNESGALALSDTIKECFAGKRIILVLGLLEDKDITKIIGIMCPLADEIIITRPDSPRAIDPYKLESMVKQVNKNTIVEPDIEKAVNLGLGAAGQHDILLVSGSLYLIGAVRTILNKA